MRFLVKKDIFKSIMGNIKFIVIHLKVDIIRFLYKIFKRDFGILQVNNY
jgi:hypothetical protein